MANPTITFRIYQDDAHIGEMSFERPVINIGKLSTSALRIDDPNVSRKHAVVELRANGSWRITDLASTNGTFIGDQAITQATLKDGDRIQIGTTVLEVMTGVSTGAAKVEAEAPELPVPKAEGGEGVRSPQKATASAGSKSPRQKPKALKGHNASSFYEDSQGASVSGNYLLEVSLLWDTNIISSKRFKPGQSVSLGTNGQHDFDLPQSLLGSSSYQLVEGTSSGFKLNLTNPNISGDILMDSEVKTVDELVKDQAEVMVGPSFKARLQVGSFVLLVSYVPEIAVIPVKKTRSTLVWLFILAALILEFSVLITARNTPNELLMTTRDERAERQKLLKALKITPEELEEKKKEAEEKAEQQEALPNQAAATNDLLKVNPNQLPTLDLPKEEQQRRQDLLNTMAKQQQDELSRLSPDERKARGEELAQRTLNSVMNDQIMNEILSFNDSIDDSNSVFKGIGAHGAAGDSGFAAGGQVDPFGSTLSGSNALSVAGGTGGTGTGGPLVGDIGKRGGPGLADLNMKQRSNEPSVVLQKPRVSGELDPNIVRRYIQQQIDGVKWCYQDRLQSQPDLSGKLTLFFTIIPDGTVTDAKTINSSINDSVLRTCIAQKVSRWRFPSPKGGGLVDVTYPLILKTQ